MKNKLTSIFTFLLILFCVFSAFFGTPEDGGESIYDSMTVPVTETIAVTEEVVPETTLPEETIAPTVAVVDDSKEAVAAYIHENGCLPDFYMTKAEARGIFDWEGGALDNLAPGRAIGGDEFHNYEGLLPEARGRYYTECDIDTIGNGVRGAKRIVFSNDGLIYYTDDHYDTFELLYGEP